MGIGTSGWAGRGCSTYGQVRSATKLLAGQTDQKYKTVEFGVRVVKALFDSQFGLGTLIWAAD
eukprot:1531177-Pyramimonas_sp.AAC.1